MDERMNFDLLFQMNIFLDPTKTSHNSPQQKFIFMEVIKYHFILYGNQYILIDDYYHRTMRKRNKQDRQDKHGLSRN